MNTGAEAQPVERVIVDTDVGDDIDDAFALALALSDPRLDVRGVTTAFGDTRLRVLLVRRLLAAFGRLDIVVAQGPATPDPTPFTQRRWAMGESDLSPAPDAVTFLDAQAQAHPGELTLIELAPMTNLAALTARDPTAIGKFRQVVVMGGSIHAGYAQGGAIPNPEPSAEYNIAQAPQAFADLLASGAQVALFPLDSTQLKLDEVRRDRLFAHGAPETDALTLLYTQWRLWNAWGQITPTLFDVIPVAWLLDPRICAMTPLRITVGADGFTHPIAGAPNVQACLSIDEGASENLIINTLAPEPAGNAQ